MTSRTAGKKYQELLIANYELKILNLPESRVGLPARGPEALFWEVAVQDCAWITGTVSCASGLLTSGWPTNQK